MVINPGLLTRLIAGVLSAAAMSAAPVNKISRDLATLEPAADVDVIVQFHSAPTPGHHARMQGKGANLKQEFSSGRAALYSVRGANLARIADDADVRYITPDRELQPTLDYTATAVGADLAFTSRWTGLGVGIAIVDSGIDTTHPDFALAKGSGRVVYSESFSNGKSAADKYGHGTHVAAIAAGSGTASSGGSYTHTFRGLAPDAHIINFRVLDGNGKGRDSAVISAIDRAIALRNQFNIRVLNLSLGHPVYESYKLDPLCQAVERAWIAGIVVVVAAGNEGRNNVFGTDGYGTINSPGNHPLVITVGAVKTMTTPSRADDVIASYSSKGPTQVDHVVKPDLVAPGNRVISALVPNSTFASSYPENVVPLAYYKRSSNGGKPETPEYYRLSGTSMAAPVVAGAAALLLQKTPSLTPDQVKARLMKTASKSFPAYSVTVDEVTGQTFRSQHDIFTVGAGYLDVYAALNSADLLPARTTAASPVAVLTAAGSIVVVNDTSAVWGAGAIWGSTALWGSSAIWGSAVWLDGASAIWGSSALWGSSAIWGSAAISSGTSAIWGSSALWGSGAIWGSTTTDRGATQAVAGSSVIVAAKGEN
jgi:serine protease AprX